MKQFSAIIACLLLAVDTNDPNLLYDPVAGEVQFSLPDADTSFFRLEIGLDE
jgi:hypothetical protein